MSLTYLNHGPLASDAIVSHAGLGVLVDVGSSLTSVGPAPDPDNGFIGAIAVSFSGGTMGHRKSTRPAEYVRMTHIQPDATKPLLRYDMDDPEPGHFPGGAVPILVNPFTGEQESPAHTFYIPNSIADNAIAEEAYVFEHTDSVGVDYKQRIWHSKRHAQVNRWHTVIGAPYNFDIEWLSENAPTAFGQGLNPAQHWTESQHTAAENQQNPSDGGKSLAEFQLDPLQVDPDDELKVPPSWVIHQKATATYVEGAVIPAHFGNKGAPANSAHNMDETHTSFFWRYRGFEHLEPNFAGPLVHRLTHLAYSPIGYTAAEFAFPPNPSLLPGVPPRFRALISNGPTIQDGLGFDQGWYADLYEDTALRNFDDLLTATSFDQTFYQHWIALIDRTVYSNIDDPANDAIGPPIFPSGAGVIVHARSSDGFAIGYASGLFAQGSDKVTQIQMINSLGGVRVTGVPVPHHSHAAGKFLYSNVEFGVRRPAGWLGNHAYVYTGPLTLVLSELRKIRNEIRGSFPNAEKIVPWNVREGTDIALKQTAVEPPEKPIKVASTSLMRGRLS